MALRLAEDLRAPLRQLRTLPLLLLLRQDPAMLLLCRGRRVWPQYPAGTYRRQRQRERN